ncbi:mitochondrial 54S ribosomal protein YmL16 [Arthroderma uncinatum]|uniref:mitochondrial 54S ribosomal protein YmL16 n=1 Tax=Arthroderma uncinatum TaxID=74035 RepID=UPI00144A6EEC|nr:mitochondrial 54S ribosomal protein YmL16 [Arthroderma uncinatum]KAF3492399.1 mitochondrial 54S ribosomal protein YmL16 [Arthroderma uncinatum]
MALAASRNCCRQLLRESSRINAAPTSTSPPSFLLPAFSRSSRSQAHPFSTSAPRESRIGASPISVPPEVSLEFRDLPKVQAASRATAEYTPVTAVDITGPLGSMTLKIPPFSTLNYDPETRKASFEVQDLTIKHQAAMWGTIRQHLRNYILGVSEGHICIVKLVGVGFRASVEPTAVTIPTPEYPGQQFISLKVGFAHPVELGIPKGVKARSTQPTTLLLEGINKETVTQFAADIRKWRPPEPYKGKGIFVNGETIKLKAKKIK